MAEFSPQSDSGNGVVPLPESAGTDGLYYADIEVSEVIVSNSSSPLPFNTPEGSPDYASTSRSNVIPLRSPRIVNRTPSPQSIPQFSPQSDSGDGVAPLPEFAGTDGLYYADNEVSEVIVSTFSSPLPFNTPEGSPDYASTSRSNVIPLSPRIVDRTPTKDDFDPKKFDPTNLSFKETYDILSELDLDKHVKLIRDTILKYSLCICGFQDCHDDDLMLAVYLYFENNFKIQAKFQFCARFDYHNEKNLVGVLLDSIHTKEEILKLADKTNRKEPKVWDNFAFHWILQGYRPYGKHSITSTNS